jgi:hypothetical protein
MNTTWLYEAKKSGTTKTSDLVIKVLLWVLQMMFHIREPTKMLTVRVSPSPTVGSPKDHLRKPIPYGEIAWGTVRARSSLTVGLPWGPFARVHPLRWDLLGDHSCESILYDERRVFTHSFSYIYVIRKVYRSYYK